MHTLPVQYIKNIVIKFAALGDGGGIHKATLSYHIVLGLQSPKNLGGLKHFFLIYKICWLGTPNL
jgi:hypothetical protein